MNENDTKKNQKPKWVVHIDTDEYLVPNLRISPNGRDRIEDLKWYKFRRKREEKLVTESMMPLLY